MLLTKEAVRKAKEILGKNGENRIKGVYYDHNKPGCFCMIGALAKAIDEDYPLNIPNLILNSSTLYIHEEIMELTKVDGWFLNDDNEWDVVSNFLDELESKLAT